MAWFKKKDEKNSYAADILAKTHQKPKKTLKQKFKRFAVRTAAALGVTSAAVTGGAYYASQSTVQDVTVKVMKVTKVTEATCARTTEEVQSPKAEVPKVDPASADGSAPVATTPASPASILAQSCAVPKVTYLIHTDKGVFQNSIDPFQKKFQGEVEDLQKTFAEAAGKTYVMKVNGKELGVLKMHQNILSASQYVEPIVPSRVSDYFSSNPFEDRGLNKNAQNYNLPLPPPII